MTSSNNASSASTPVTPKARNRLKSESSSAGGASHVSPTTSMKLPDAARLQNMKLQDFISLVRAVCEVKEIHFESKAQNALCAGLSKF